MLCFKTLATSGRIVLRVLFKVHMCINVSPIVLASVWSSPINTLDDFSGFRVNFQSKDFKFNTGETNHPTTKSPIQDHLYNTYLEAADAFYGSNDLVGSPIPHFRQDILECEYSWSTEHSLIHVPRQTTSPHGDQIVRGGVESEPILLLASPMGRVG